RRSQRLQVEAALRRALKSGELMLHFQPIIAIDSGEVRKVEALIRWLDPQRGLVMPPGFLPLAEESGLGQAIGHWVLEAAGWRAPSASMSSPKAWTSARNWNFSRARAAAPARATSSARRFPPTNSRNGSNCAAASPGSQVKRSEPQRPQRPQRKDGKGRKQD